MKINSTFDYSQFTIIKQNREVNPSHLDKIIKSLKRLNFLEVNPIIVTKNEKCVIDGQHRLLAAQKLEIPIYYVELDLKEHEIYEIIEMANTNVEKWSLWDYANFFANMGKDDYREVIEFARKYNIPMSSANRLLAGYKHPSSIFKAGDFKVTRAEFAERIIKTSKMYEKYALPQSLIRGTRFLSVLIRLDKKEIDQERMREKLEDAGKTIRYCSSTRDYMRILEDIYNHKVKEGFRIRFY